MVETSLELRTPLLARTLRLVLGESPVLLKLKLFLVVCSVLISLRIAKNSDLLHSLLTEPHSDYPNK